MLKQNGTLLAQYPVRLFGGGAAGDAAMNRRSETRNFGTHAPLAALPVGHLAPSAWRLPMKTGGLGATAFGGDSALSVGIAGGRNAEAAVTGAGGVGTAAIAYIGRLAALLDGDSAVAASLAGAVQLTAATSGAGSLSASIAAAVDALASLAGSSSLTASAAASLPAAATLAGSGVVNAQVAGAVSAVAGLIGSGSLSVWNVVGAWFASASPSGQAAVTATLAGLGRLAVSLAGQSATTGAIPAKGSMGAQIRSYSDLSPEGLASAVWRALAAASNDPNTMGALLHDAAAGGGGGGASAEQVWSTPDIEAGLTPRAVLRALLAVAAGETEITSLGGGNATVRFKAQDGSTDRVVVQMDDSTRTSSTITP